MRVGLVLGAGGVTGGSWLTGALHALVEETGWDPGSADIVVGTSAGSVVGTIIAAGGVPLWIMASDYATGQRVAFGRAGSPEADLADAVAASCAIPGFYRAPVIGGRRYVDGGVCSVSNLDVVADEGLDLVICLNPASSRDR